jgi:hypothetical protein
MAEFVSGKFLQIVKITAWVINDIIIVKAKDQVFLELQDAREMTGVFEQLTTMPLPLLVDFHTMRGQTGDCRKYFAHDENHSRLVSATALMVTSPVSRALSFFFTAIAKPIRPTRFFADEAEALQWLMSHRTKRLHKV